ncbi:MAG TPA: hypothetical protein VF115_12215, partial [Acidimicrobiia bacterium]
TRDEWYQGYVGQQLIGSPDDVSEKIEWIDDRASGIGGMIFMSREWAGVDEAHRSWRLFAEKVMPRF